jgi:hypothetical protein
MDDINLLNHLNDHSLGVLSGYLIFDPRARTAFTEGDSGHAN